MKLPPLLKPYLLAAYNRAVSMWECGGDPEAFEGPYTEPTIGLFTADQLCAYGRACAEAMREECAKTCNPSQYPNEADRNIAHKCAAAIREIEVER